MALWSANEVCVALVAEIGFSVSSGQVGPPALCVRKDVPFPPAFSQVFNCCASNFSLEYILLIPDRDVNSLCFGGPTGAQEQVRHTARSTITPSECSAATPAPCRAVWESRPSRPKFLGSCHHVGDPGGVLGSRF